MNLPFSQACENNKQPIADVLEKYLSNASGTVLEIGSCTAQHIVFFASCFPTLQWQPSDQQDYLAGIEARLAREGAENINPAFPLDVRKQWPDKQYDFCFTANTCHIMAKESVADLFSGVSECLQKSGLFFIYGPFKFNGEYTSASNADFDLWLKDRDPQSGIRDFEYLLELAKSFGFSFEDNHKMPANNQLLVFRRNTK